MRVSVPHASLFAQTLAACLAVICVAVSALPAQQTAAQDPIPQVVTSGTGEAQITPDRARIDIAVETRGATAALAAQENARITTVVLARVKAFGLTDAQLSTWGYNVNAEYDYNRNEGRPRIIGYTARNTVRADVRQLSQLGQVIDGAVAAGANNISGLDFYSSSMELARGRALTLAVQRARSDAEIMASAAGGRLGALLELSSSFSQPPPMPYMARMEVSAQADATPISAGERTITVTVNARWRFVTGG